MITKIILVVTLITQPNQKDIYQSRRMTSIDDCSVAAKEWLTQDIEKGGGIGYAAQCLIFKSDTDDNETDN